MYEQLSIFDIQNDKELYVKQISYEDTKPFILNIIPVIANATLNIVNKSQLL